MMKRYTDLPFRWKILLIFGIAMVAITLSLTVLTSVTTSRFVAENAAANLEMLTEQSLMNFVSVTDRLARSLVDQLSSRQIPADLYALGHTDKDSAAARELRQTLTTSLTQMLYAPYGYGQVYLRTTGGDSVWNTGASGDFLTDAEQLLGGSLGEKAFGRIYWRRMRDGSLYLIRDIYRTQPLRYAGKAVAQILPSALPRLGSYNNALQCTVVFLREGTPIATSGVFSQSLMEAVPATLSSGEATLAQGKETYLLRVHASEGWTAVGLMPQSRLRQMQVRTLQSSLLAGFVALMVGALMILLATRRLTRRMDLLVDSMDAMSGGNLDITVPVDATDEIGRVGAHFNTMVATTKELLAQVVEEENRKNKAEYDMLEYKYRSLQSQINPHFIYNALEVVNAMAKLDGNEAICDVVRHISSFFRQNGGNMNKRFITVAQEFSSLGQYASIYCYIYGDILSTPFHLEEAAAPALIPTMILQPVMENALVHGIRGEHAVVTLTARKDGDNRLSILVEDNGTGMPPETIAAILSDDAPVPVGESTGSGIGMRNVRDRLRLIYGEDCSLTIHSSEEGTRVEIGIPFRLRE